MAHLPSRWNIRFVISRQATERMGICLNTRARRFVTVCSQQPTAIRHQAPWTCLPLPCLVARPSYRYHNPQRPAPRLATPSQRPDALDAKLGLNGDDDASTDMSLDALQSLEHGLSQNTLQSLDHDQSLEHGLSQNAPADGRGSLCGGCKLSVESDTGGIVVAFGHVPDLFTILTAC